MVRTEALPCLRPHPDFTAEPLVASEASYAAEDGLGQPSAHRRQVIVEDYAHMISVGSHEWCTTRITGSTASQGLAKRVLRIPLMLQHLPAPKCSQGLQNSFTAFLEGHDAPGEILSLSFALCFIFKARKDFTQRRAFAC